jgi:hypothetical protein
MEAIRKSRFAAIYQPFHDLTVFPQGFFHDCDR